MKVLGARSAREASNVFAHFRLEHPQLGAQLAKQMREGGRFQVQVHEGEEFEPATALDLTLTEDDDVAFRITWADESVQTLPVDELGMVLAEGAKLPECSGFVGQGRRCESCRIRKAMHS